MKKFCIVCILCILASCNRQMAEQSAYIGVDSESIASTQIGTKIASDAGYMACIESARVSCGNNFIQAYAKNNSSVEVCDEFSDENLRVACREMVITETAKKTLDASRCNALKEGDARATCKQEVIYVKGVKNADPTVCSNYELTSTETDALENMKDRCTVHIIYQLPPSEKVKNLCGLVIDEELRSVCEERISSQITPVSDNIAADVGDNSENE